MTGEREIGPGSGPRSTGQGLGRLVTGCAKVGWVQWTVVIITNVVAVALLLLTGVVGKGREPMSAHPEERSVFGVEDFIYLYAGGSAWASGQSPYDPAVLRDAGAAALRGSSLEAATGELTSAFAYPPTASVPFALLAALPFGTARTAFAAINIASAGLLAIAGVLMIGARARYSPYRVLVTGGSVALTIGSPFVSHNLWMGQSSMVVVALLCGSFLAERGVRPALSGVGAAISTLKPTPGVFVIASMVLGLRRRAVIAMIIACAALAGLAIRADGPVGTAREWLASVDVYRQATQNQPGFQHSFGVRSLLYDAGVVAPPLGAAGLLAFGGLWWFRRFFGASEFFAACLALAVLFVHAHDYDLVGVIPLFVVLLGRHAGSLAALAGITGVVVITYVPLRFVVRPDFPLLGRYREVAVLVLLAWLLVGVAREGRRRGAVAATISSTDEGEGTAGTLRALSGVSGDGPRDARKA
jgi:hypothetical protein